MPLADVTIEDADGATALNLRLPGRASPQSDVWFETRGWFTEVSADPDIGYLFLVRRGRQRDDKEARNRYERLYGHRPVWNLRANRALRPTLHKYGERAEL